MKTETQHTPGPWQVDRWSGLLAPYFVAGKRNGDGCVIADKLYDEDNEPTLEEVEANAHLIAAAPELLEVLKQALCVLLKFDCSQFQPNIVEQLELIKTFRAVIAKAEGKSA